MRSNSLNSKDPKYIAIKNGKQIYKPLTREEHYVLAVDLAIANVHSARAYKRLAFHYPESHELIGYAEKLSPHHKNWLNLRYDLDQHLKSVAASGTAGNVPDNLYFYLQEIYRSLIEADPADCKPSIDNNK